MADLVIRGMEMPTNVYDCPLNTFGFCNLAHDSNHIYCIGDSRPEWCPLAPLPEGHGRLGDLDKLEESLRMAAAYQTGERQQGILGCCETIRMAKTIIPAEGWTDDGN